MIDVAHHTGFHYALQQTRQELIAKAGGVYQFYASVLIGCKDSLKAVAGNIVVADAFFSNKTFYNCLKAEDFVLLSRMQKGTKMRYKYIGIQKTKGRRKVYGSKVDVKAIDLEHFTLFAETTEKGITEKCYEGVVYIDTLKVWAKVVIVQNFESDTQRLKSTQIYFSTYNTMKGIMVIQYYRLRFQIEFLFRDTKQHLGLTQCQSTNEKVLHFHWNLALTVLNIAKAVHWMPKAQDGRKAFSIADIKTLYFNQLYLNTFIAAFGITTDNENNSPIIKRLLAWGTKAA